MGTLGETMTDVRTRFISIDDHPTISEALLRASESYDDLEMVGSFRSIESVPNPLRIPRELTDVAVVDLTLPGVRGLDGVAAVVGWGLDVVVFSATAHERVAREALRRGARGFIGKSAPTVEVLDAIRRASRGDRFIVDVESTPGPVVDLTASEEHLLRHLSSETRSAALAAVLGISPATVDNRIWSLYDKVGLEGNDRTRPRLASWAAENGFSLPD